MHKSIRCSPSIALVSLVFFCLIAAPVVFLAWYSFIGDPDFEKTVQVFPGTPFVRTLKCDPRIHHSKGILTVDVITLTGTEFSGRIEHDGQIYTVANEDSAMSLIGREIKSGTQLIVENPSRDETLTVYMNGDFDCRQYPVMIALYFVSALNLFCCLVCCISCIADISQKRDDEERPYLRLGGDGDL